VRTVPPRIGPDRERTPPATEPPERLDAGDDPECAVVPAPLRDGVEVRAGPDLRQVGPRSRLATGQVSRRIDVDGETGFPHPARDELVRILLGAAQAGPVRAPAAAEGIEPLESVEDAGGGAGGRGARRHASIFVEPAFRGRAGPS